MEPVYILLAYFLDLICGDPPRMPHPVKLMGKLAKFVENRFMPGGGGKHLHLKGVILTLTVAGASTAGAFIILNLSGKLHPLAGSLVWVALAYTCIAGKDLYSHAKRVQKAVEAGDLGRARKELSQIVGRDTENLNEEGIMKAAVESVAESSNDGIIAPLFYLILGGPVAAIGYKAINTLDSMVGYNNEKYGKFGWFPAKVDDAANFIPARIAGILITVSSFLTGKGFIRSFKTMRRDGKKHPSPNSGIPEAAMAGALGLRLGGPSSYAGKLAAKPYIGEDVSPAGAKSINKALCISFVSSLLMVLSGAALKWLL